MVSGWEPAGLPDNYVWNLAVDPLNSSLVYAGTAYGLSRSSNGGKRWVKSDKGIQYGTVTTVVVDPLRPSSVYAASNFGVFKSAVGGAAWAALDQGWSGQNVSSLALADSTTPVLHAGTFGQGVFDIEFSCSYFCDDFEDNDDSGWTMSGSGTWNPVDSDLVGTTAAKAAIAISPPFTAPAVRTIDADLQIQSAGAQVSLFAWYLGRSRTVELRLEQDKGRILLKQSNSTASTSQKYFTTLVAGQSYHFRISYDGTTFLVFMDQGPVPVISMRAIGQPKGVVAFQVKSTTGTAATGSMGDISVN